MALFIEAVTLVGCRAIIQTSSLKYPANSRMESIYFMGQHPHQPVFEKCAAVVHHGGAGTSHAATRAGCPSVVVPFILKKSVESNPAKKIQHKLDNMFLSIDGI